MTIALTVKGRDNIVMATDSCLTVDESRGIYWRHVQKTFWLPSPLNIGVSFSGCANIAPGVSIDTFIYNFIKFCIANTHTYQSLDDIAMLLIDRIRLTKTSAGVLHALVAGYVSVDGMKSPKVWHLSSTSSVEDESFHGPGVNGIGECAVLDRIFADPMAGNHIPGHNDLRCFTVQFSEFSVEDSINYCNRVIQLTEAEHENVSSPSHMLLITPAGSRWIAPPPIDMGLNNPLA